MWRHLYARASGCTTAAVLFALGCSEVTGNGSDLPETLPEDRGSAITPEDAVGYWSELVWSPDDREIYFIALPPSGPFTIRAAAVDDGGQRDLDAASRQYQSLQLSPDGTLLYYLASEAMDGGAYAVHVVDVAGGDPAKLVDSVQSFVLSQDGAYLAFTRTSRYCSGIECDSLRVVTLATGQEVPVTSGEPLTFSPDGASIVSARANVGTMTDTYYVTRIEDGATHELDIDESEGWVRSVRWDEKGLQALLEALTCAQGGCSEQFLLRDLETGGIRQVWEYVGRDWGGPELKAWSADGERFAFLTWHCVEAEDLFTCAVPQYKLHEVAPTEGREAIVAVVNATVGITAFARTRRSIAYSADSRIYVVDY